MKYIQGEREFGQSLEKLIQPPTGRERCQTTGQERQKGLSKQPLLPSATTEGRKGDVDL